MQFVISGFSVCLFVKSVSPVSPFLSFSGFSVSPVSLFVISVSQVSPYVCLSFQFIRFLSFYGFSVAQVSQVSPVSQFLSFTGFSVSPVSLFLRFHRCIGKSFPFLRFLRSAKGSDRAAVTLEHADSFSKAHVNLALAASNSEAEHPVPFPTPMSVQGCRPENLVVGFPVQAACRQLPISLSKCLLPWHRFSIWTPTLVPHVQTVLLSA